MQLCVSERCRAQVVGAVWRGKASGNFRDRSEREKASAIPAGPWFEGPTEIATRGRDKHPEAGQIPNSSGHRPAAARANATVQGRGSAPGSAHRGRANRVQSPAPKGNTLNARLKLPLRTPLQIPMQPYSRVGLLLQKCVETQRSNQQINVRTSSVNGLPIF
jgi:hypothetical protein